MPRPRRTEIVSVARYAERDGTPVRVCGFVTFVFSVFSLASISASLVRLEGARGKEEKENDGRNDVEDAPRVDDAPGKVVHVLEDVQIRQGIAQFGKGQKVPRDSDDEGSEDEDERENGRHDLVLREGRGERARGDEKRPDERDPEVPRKNRAEVETSEAGQKQRVQRGRHEQKEEEAPGSRELGGDDAGLGHRRRQKRLDGAGLALLRQEPHRDDRRDEHQEDPLEHVREERGHEGHPRRLGRVQSRDENHEHPSAHEQERREDEIPERRDEIREELSLDDRAERSHGRASMPSAGVVASGSAAPGSVSTSTAASRETRRTKTSSSEASRGVSSRRTHPRRTDSR